MGPAPAARPERLFLESSSFAGSARLLRRRARLGAHAPLVELVSDEHLSIRVVMQHRDALMRASGGRHAQDLPGVARGEMALGHSQHNALEGREDEDDVDDSDETKSSWLGRG